jgi:hypothetical protein
MTLIVQKPTGAKLNLRKTWQPMDADAAAYITAVEAADTAAGQSGGLETAVKVAIHSFVKGCKADGVWPAIKASCILAGARTLAGALIPLVGTAPTNPGNVFVQADYNRKTGLVGDGSTKYLSSNRNADAQPQNSIHVAAYATNAGTTGYALGAGGTASNAVNLGLPTVVWRLNSGAYQPSGGVNAGLTGISRSVSTEFILRRNGANETAAVASAAPLTTSLFVFGRSAAASTNARLAFYSIGESLDLALLDARVTDLINAFGVAIP